MYTRDLKRALTQSYASTSRAFTEVIGVWPLREKVNARFSLCIERRVYKRILYEINQSISSAEQRVFI